MKKLARIALAYAGLQAVIWVKAFAFFFSYGYGAVGRYNQLFFPQEAILFNFWFHEGMHVAIGVLALAFGKNLAKVEWSRLVPAVLAAVAIHNVAYWFTRVHSSLMASVKDFVSDFVVLLAFVLLGFALRRQINRFKLLNAL
jgi:hypothetical protein